MLCPSRFSGSSLISTDKFDVMFGGLHIEMAALKMVGDWLKRSGWVQALVQANITTTGTADSFSCAAHVTHTRRAHQVTLAVHLDMSCLQ